MVLGDGGFVPSASSDDARPLDTERGEEPPVSSQLFRADALDSTRAKWMGEIVVVSPLRTNVWATFCGCVGAALIAFAIFGKYTRRTAIPGQLVPDTGLVKVYAAESATIVEKRVREGDHVSKGEVLYVLSADRVTTKVGGEQAAISEDVEARVRSLEDTIRRTRALEQTERATLSQKMTDLLAEGRVLTASIGLQEHRVALSKEAADRYGPLATQGYVSRDQFEAKEQDLFQQRSALRDLERSQLELRKDLADTQSQLRELSANYSNKIADLARDIETARGELSQSEARRQFVAVAPTDGIATDVIGELGETMDPNKPLTEIVPAGARLEAELYATSRSVGFIQVGSPVVLRFTAFPYQKFGSARGRVVSVDHAVLSSAELLGLGMQFPSESDSSEPSSSNEPVYRVTVSLPSQVIRAYGNDRPLESGMRVDATVLQETRRIYEWILEPLYSITGKIR